MAVGYGFYYFSLNWFKEHKSGEKIIALQLVDAFVTNYSAIRSQFGQDAPVPASFRAHAIEAFNKQNGDNSDFRLRSVGRPGREILTPPTDARMAQTHRGLRGDATTQNRCPSCSTSTANRCSARSIRPWRRNRVASSCHNALQPDKAQWHLNDVIGAFVIDVPISPFLRTVMWQSAGIGVGLFLALALAGLMISLIHFRQLEALDASAAKLGRTQNFLDSIIENMPVSVAVKDARDRCYVLINRTAEAIFGIARGDLIGKPADDPPGKETVNDLFPLAGEALRTRDLQIIDEHVVRYPSQRHAHPDNQESFDTGRDRRTALSPQPFGGHYRAQAGRSPHPASGTPRRPDGFAQSRRLRGASHPQRSAPQRRAKNCSPC